MGELHELRAGEPLRHGHLLHDTSFRFISVNPTACALLGYTEAELLGMGLRDIEPDFDRYGIRERMLAMKSGEQLHTSGRPRHRDGHLVPVEVSVSALDAGEQRLFAVVLTARAEQLLPLTDHVAHELNNTAQAMLGLLDDIRLRQRAQVPPTWADVAVLSFATRQLISLGNTLQQRSAEKTERLTLCPLVARALEAARRSGELEAVSLLHLPPPHPLDVQVNPERVERVLLNLVRNAAQAMAHSPRRRLTVEYTVDGGWARCHVSDTGPGVDPSVAGRLFEPGVSTRRADGSSRGYGLSIAREDVRVYGGELTVSSVSGGGACFTVALPICAP